MKSITIDAPEGYKIDTFDESTGKVTFAPIPKSITERIKTFDDVLAELNIDPTSFSVNNCDLEDHEVAHRQLVLIAKALNEGWQPDWGNTQQLKWYPWFDMGGSSGSGFACDGAGGRNAYSDAGSRLCFKSSELAKYAATQFLHIYKTLYLI